MRIQGRLHNWHDELGIGFITPRHGGKPAFAQRRAFRHLQRPPRNGDLLSYCVSRDPQGRLSALDIRQQEVRMPRFRPPYAPPRRQRGISPLLLLFVLLLAGSTLLGYLPAAIGGLYLLLSLLTYAVYARDKRAAQQNRWRVRENTLHLLAVLGGWPGALLAQQRLRHKSSKPGFQWRYKVSIAANLGLLLWLQYTISR
ncbi:DUF1294 domain-containing protein [Vogesella oryzae]|uniref:DUF1294 domain-containing protein n=1 Tax=Vogesella oryzae TaxID=1735285 RepID=UPI001582C3BA|nr:DUF1294 domain-containing protein [Vogesella oryzae]